MVRENRPHVLSASTLEGDPVVNEAGEDMGTIEEIMLDLDNGRVAYAVLSFGGFLGLGDKLFAIPWDALAVDTENERFVLDLDKEQLESAPGFDKDDWPDMSDPMFHQNVYSHYGLQYGAAAGTIR